jgi:hypothetical protein
MKAAMTDMAFTITRKVWTDLPESANRVKRGSCYFQIGGVNAVNPFSATAIKNEIAVYSEITDKDMPRLDTVMGATYDMSAKQCAMNLDDYAEIYLDFNGSMAFLNEEWAERMATAASVGKLKGVFVMGGVRSDTKPLTMPSIPNVLNRFSRCVVGRLCPVPYYYFEGLKRQRR